MTTAQSLWTFLRRNRPRWFVQRSMRGLLDVMPAQDASFRGIAFGWKGIGLVDFDKHREAEKPRHEWDDVRWQEFESEYEASCWCGWTHSAWAHDAAEQALREHLKENGVTVA